jgi:hypothetical protein
MLVIQRGSEQFPFIPTDNVNFDLRMDSGFVRDYRIASQKKIVLPGGRRLRFEQIYNLDQIVEYGDLLNMEEYHPGIPVIVIGLKGTIELSVDSSSTGTLKDPCHCKTNIASYTVGHLIGGCRNTLSYGVQQLAFGMVDAIDNKGNQNIIWEDDTDQYAFAANITVPIDS